MSQVLITENRLPAGLFLGQSGLSMGGEGDVVRGESLSGS